MALSLRDKIFRRAGHIVFEYEGRMCIWGGFTERVPTVKINLSVSVESITYHSINCTLRLKVQSSIKRLILETKTAK